MFFQRPKIRKPTIEELKAQSKSLQNKLTEIKSRKELTAKIKVDAQELKKEKFREDRPILGKIVDWAREKGKKKQLEAAKLKRGKKKSTPKIFASSDKAPWSESSNNSDIYTSGMKDLFHEKKKK